MPYEIRVDKDFAGPSLQDLEPVLSELEDPVEVRWSGSKGDILAQERQCSRSLILIVPDVETAEKTLWVLGGVLTLPEDELKAAKCALFSKYAPSSWRKKAEALGIIRSTLLLTKVAADAVRKGVTPRPGLSVAADVVLNHVSPVDADVILRLRFGKL